MVTGVQTCALPICADGHNWSLAANANDYLEKTWPTDYGVAAEVTMRKATVPSQIIKAVLFGSIVQEQALATELMASLPTIINQTFPYLKIITAPTIQAGIKQCVILREWVNGNAISIRLLLPMHCRK